MAEKKAPAPPWVTAPLASPVRRPQLRCPACGSPFTPPADICGHCQIDLRLGRRRKRRWLPQWLKIPPRILRALTTVTALGLTLALVVAGVNGLRDYLGRPPAAPVAVPRAPDSFQRLAGEYPALLRPYVVMYKTQAAVADYRDNLTYRQHFMEELAKSVQADGSKISEKEALAMSRQMTPGQRLRMLKELMAITAPPGNTQISDQELMREMAPSQISQELKNLDKNSGGQ